MKSFEIEHKNICVVKENEYSEVFKGEKSQALGGTRGYTSLARNKKTTFPENENSELDVAIITAVDDEYYAVLNAFPGTTQPNYENGASCFRQYSVKNKREISVGLFQQDAMGMVCAAILASKIIYKYKPKLLAMCGICAGIDKEKMNLGDVVAFSPVYEYRAGKIKNGAFSPAYKQREVDENVKRILDKMVHDKVLLNDIRSSATCNSKPRESLNAYIGYSASGAAVLADKEHVNKLLEHQRNLSAIDMEAYAIAEAACLAGERRVPWLVVKGVQDFADSSKSDDYREYAAFVSVEFMRRFLDYYFEK